MGRESAKGKGVNNFRITPEQTKQASTSVSSIERIKRTYYLHKDVIKQLDRVFHLRKLDESETPNLDRSMIVEEALKTYLSRFEID